MVDLTYESAMRLTDEDRVPYVADVTEQLDGNHKEMIVSENEIEGCKTVMQLMKNIAPSAAIANKNEVNSECSPASLTSTSTSEPLQENDTVTGKIERIGTAIQEEIDRFEQESADEHVVKYKSMKDVSVKNENDSKDVGFNIDQKYVQSDMKIRGVCYCRSDRSWTAWWTEKGRNRKKAFKLSLYGYMEAKRLAIAYRSQIEERLPELRLSKSERKVNASAHLCGVAEAIGGRQRKEEITGMDKTKTIHSSRRYKLTVNRRIENMNVRRHGNGNAELINTVNREHVTTTDGFSDGPEDKKYALRQVIRNPTRYVTNGTDSPQSGSMRKRNCKRELGTFGQSHGKDNVFRTELADDRMENKSNDGAPAIQDGLYSGLIAISGDDSGKRGEENITQKKELCTREEGNSTVLMKKNKAAEHRSKSGNTKTWQKGSNLGESNANNSEIIMGNSCSITVFSDSKSIPATASPLNIPGIYYNRSRYSVVAFVRVQHRKKYKTFPIRNYENIEAARNAALKWRSYMLENIRSEDDAATNDQNDDAAPIERKSILDSPGGSKSEASITSPCLRAANEDVKKSTRGISFSAVNNAWCAQWCNSAGAACLKSFSVSKYGYEGAKALAMKHRQELEASNQVGSRISGVVFQDSAWKAIWKEPSGESCSVTFTVGQNGFTYDSARRLAIACRKNEGNLSFLHGWDYMIRQSEENEDGDGISSRTANEERTNASLDIVVKPKAAYHDCKAVKRQVDKAVEDAHENAHMAHDFGSRSQTMTPREAEDGTAPHLLKQSNRNTSKKRISQNGEEWCEASVNAAGAKSKKHRVKAESTEGDTASTEVSPIIVPHSPSGSVVPPGIFYDTLKRGFCVSWTNADGDTETQVFSVRWSGYNAAKQMAIMLHKELQRKGLDIKLSPTFSDVRLATPNTPMLLANTSPSISPAGIMPLLRNSGDIVTWDSSFSELGLDGWRNPANLREEKGKNKEATSTVGNYTYGEVPSRVDNEDERNIQGEAKLIVEAVRNRSIITENKLENEKADFSKWRNFTEFSDKSTETPSLSDRTTVSDLSPASLHSVGQEIRGTSSDYGLLPLLWGERKSSVGTTEHAPQEFLDSKNTNARPALTQSLLLRIQGMCKEQIDASVIEDNI